VTLKDSARVVDNTATVAGGGIYIVGAALNACTTWTSAISRWAQGATATEAYPMTFSSLPN
jgi:hypothetical protein